MLESITKNTMKQKHSKLCWSINSLHEGKNTFHLSITPAELDLDPKNTTIKGPIEADITLTKNGTKVILEGKAVFSLVLECARCFATFTLKFQEALSAYYFSEKLPYRDTEGLSKEEVLSEQYFDDTIDAQQLLHDTITLAKPMKPLCSDGCKGLCPICGQNLNTAQCTCKKDNSDPRWEPLKKLMK
jgi:uncharacterized protein